MLLKPIKCEKCGAPITGKERDLMLQCPACGTIYLFDQEKCGICNVAYSIISPAKEGKPEDLIYLPFWVVHAQLDVYNEDISGGGIRRAIKDQRQMRGERDFYVCAAETIPEETTRIWNMDLTISQPALTPKSGFNGVSRIVMSMEKEAALSAAEFLFLRYETEIPGTLQKLEYDFKVREVKVVYLPAFKTGNGFTLAV